MLSVKFTDKSQSFPTSAQDERVQALLKYHVPCLCSNHNLAWFREYEQRKQVADFKKAEAAANQLKQEPLTGESSNR